MSFGWRVPAGLAAISAALLAVLAISACAGTGLVKQYEYDEDIYLSTDGSAIIYLNASIPALVSLRGLDLDTRPTANIDRAAVRRLFTSEATRVTRVSRWRRFGRQFVQVRMAVDDVTKLGSAAPFSWATYQLDHRDGLVVYRQSLGASAAKPIGDVGWKGDELVAVRVHLPSRIRYHNAGPGNLKRGNILVWEQSLADRQAGKPLEIEAHIERTSILYSTLMLFAASGLLALLVLASLIWWVVRKGKRAA
ncbi:MAG: hypothetical protein MUE61_20455 [Vicinamibacterales bacterium]|jgi:hypothetical protein|nr:hypothetical protein [Vicinamibacterales bacterium]